jgi:hypothetical protein
MFEESFSWSQRFESPESFSFMGFLTFCQVLCVFSVLSMLQQIQRTGRSSEETSFVLLNNPPSANWNILGHVKKRHDLKGLSNEMDLGF